MNADLDNEGYPTDEFLADIGKMEVIAEMDNYLERIRSAWWCSDWGFIYRKAYRDKRPFAKGSAKYRTLELHTGGWSGNESIINALTHSMLWVMYWEKTYRGGHYYFKIPVKDSRNS